jgi:hypothetical protein
VRPVLAALAAALVAVYIALAVSAARGDAATFDEPAHLPAGYTYWQTGDFRLNPEHPPLAKLLAAAPLLLLHPAMRTDGDEAWRLRRQWEFGRRFLYRWNDADRLLFWGRMPIVALGALLCLSVFLWSRAWLGTGPALVALWLAAFSPDLVAHGHLVTTDVALTLFVFLATVAWWSALKRGGTASTLLAGLAVGAALATKFSAVVLLPILLVLALVHLRAARPELRRVAAAGAVVAFVAWVAVWASYGFHARVSPDPDTRAALEWENVRPANALADGGLQLVRASRLMPEAWTFGCMRFLRHAEARPAFLHGRLSASGFASYFPVTFLVKTPIPLMLLLGLALAWSRGSRAETWPVLVVPLVVYSAMVASSGLNIGHRHLLPLYPFLFLQAERAAAGLSMRTTRAAIVTVLLAWYAGGTLRAHPHELAYFNEAAGGPDGGHLWLVDSSLDWGQDLKGLAQWARAAAVPRLKLSYFGTADPAYYGLQCDYLPGQMLPQPRDVVRRVDPGDVVAVSATNLQGVYLEPADRTLMDVLRTRTPVAVIGHSIFVYRADFTWEGR